MALNNYATTALEDWVSNWYIRNYIDSPMDLKIEKIAQTYRIFIHQKEVPARFDIVGRYKAIVLDKRCSQEEQREQFFHELCHILRHTGHQTMMPESFRELQEWDANHFTLYAALPYHMIKQYDFENPGIISTLAQDFEVTEDLCRDRLNKINRKTTNMQSSYLLR
ncbi:protein of unknown function [Salinibacillus kushneri]|uniref:IrrE N-terminal-like domain-containing protein n=1 Tax=Salinibacillus kushneri TaxID=237682 RepID=A0A1I0B1S8_9BACI|nr:ImmA/IrrE family metallo-endopeptidase [Salinibacillus kushneri]SET00422.1 protein of unknown function [Salinibacillus kushneri]